MAEPFVNEASSLVSLLIAQSHGTVEAVLCRVEIHEKVVSDNEEQESFR